jgi:hypothetical protein
MVCPPLLQHLVCADKLAQQYCLKDLLTLSCQEKDLRGLAHLKHPLES